LPDPTDGAHAEGVVVAVSSDGKHRFSKPNRTSINLIEGLGVEGDAHAGAFVKHRWLARRNAALPNLRQVHLIHAELFDELCAIGFEVTPGALGENITTRGLDLLALPLGSRLHIGESAVVEVTGIREPCAYIDKFQKGLLRAMIVKEPGKAISYKSGLLGVARGGGVIRPDDRIAVALPAKPWTPLPAL
jgi:hypothetical protein